MDKKIDIVIVNWNAGKLLSDCVSSIQQYEHGLVNKVIIVDNASTDDSLSYLPNNYEKLYIINQKENVGFAKACNIGAHLSTSDYILFFNPDARIMEDSLQKTLIFMEDEKNSSIGICGVKLLDENTRVQRHCAYFPTLTTYFSHCTGLSAIFSKRFKSHFMVDFDHLDSLCVDQVIGAYFFVRRKLFSLLNGFDEKYFVYFEDLDFSLRAKNIGWKSFYYADAVAYHKGGGVSAQVKSRRLFYSLRSRLKYCFTHFSLPAAWMVFFLTLFIEPISRVVRGVLRASLSEIKNTIEGYILLLKDLPNILKNIRCNEK